MSESEFFSVLERIFDRVYQQDADLGRILVDALEDEMESRGM